ncbi:RDD family protein [Glutamicibacter sp.]|uniref:RDD family protein n=1 Tax=Glutamicibacter sp. TaxID=1931995 RepID=UPI0028BEE173|nr:RDD family protein [Glutamicibacter sp.]
MDVHASPLTKAYELGMRPSSIRLRLWSYVIDYAIWLLALLPAGIGFVVLKITGQLSLVPGVLMGISGLLSLVYLIVLLMMNSRSGSSPGKSAMRLRAVSLEDYSVPGFFRVVTAGVILLFSNVIPVIGPLLLLFSNIFDKQNRRSWLDQLMGIWVVDTRSGIDPTNPRVLSRAQYLLTRPDRDTSEHLATLSTASVQDENDEAELIARPRSSAGIVGAQNSDWQAAPVAETTPRIEVKINRRPVLEFDDGSIFPIPVSGLIGRSPQAEASWQDALLIPLKDPERMLSKTHLAFGGEGSEVWIMDLGSSNGTQVATASGPFQMVPANVRIPLHEGDQVLVGSRTFFMTYQETAQ